MGFGQTDRQTTHRYLDWLATKAESEMDLLLLHTSPALAAQTCLFMSFLPSTWYDVMYIYSMHW